MKVKVTRSLVNDNVQEFNVGSDVAFDYEGATYIAEIYEIGETNFIIGNIVIIGNIECGKQHVDGIQMIPIEAVKEFRHVYYD